MPYKLFHEECKKQKYDLELLQNTFATSFEQVAHRVTCLQDPKLPGIPFHMLRVDIAGNISKRFSLSGIEIPRYGGACPRWNIYSAFTNFLEKFMLLLAKCLMVKNTFVLQELWKKELVDMVSQKACYLLD